MANGCYNFSSGYIGGILTKMYSCVVTNLLQVSTGKYEIINATEWKKY